MATLTHLHMGLDPGGYADQYTVAWEDLSLTIIPEPTSLALIALGAGLLIVRRRVR